MTIQDRQQTLSEIAKLHSETTALEDQVNVARAKIRAKKAQIGILNRLLDDFKASETTTEEMSYDDLIQKPDLRCKED